MNVLLIGTGGVGEAIAAIVKKQDPQGTWLRRMILSDYSLNRAEEVTEKLKDSRFISEQVDASSKEQIISLAEKHEADFIMNACAPSFNMPIFEAAYEFGCTYMDMAMSLSRRHPKDPYRKTHVKLGDDQYASSDEWERKGLLALVGSGVEPGMVNVFARYASTHLFDSIEELGVRDADNLTVEGLDIAFGFSIWTTIEECLNPPVIWEKGKGWYTTESFSDPEVFPFPEPVGPTEVINVEHEEVLMLPRFFESKGLKRCTFKYGVDRDFQRVLKTLEALGLDRTEPVNVKGVEVAPRDVVGVTAPDPARIGHLMKGVVSAGLWVKGKKEGLERSVYLYQLADNQVCMKETGSQAVVAQTAFNPVIMMELIAKGVWTGSGVKGPEWFPPEPFMERMERYGFPPGMTELDSEYKRYHDGKALTSGFLSER